MSKVAKWAQPAQATEIIITPRSWLRPTFLVSRSHYIDLKGRKVELPPVYVAVLAADENTATYEVLGSNASPVTVSKEPFVAMLKERGVKQ